MLFGMIQGHIDRAQLGLLQPKTGFDRVFWRFCRLLKGLNTLLGYINARRSSHLKDSGEDI